ncbi:MAG: hypothetical protein GY756_01475 [bacterium]|nr:hypothetical protein [bacterium]
MGLSNSQKRVLDSIGRKYKELGLEFPTKYTVDESKASGIFWTTYPMRNAALKIDNMRRVSEYKRRMHTPNPFSPFAFVAEKVMTHLKKLLVEYEGRRLGRRPDSVRYLLIYENLEAAYKWGTYDLTPISLKEVISRCLLYEYIGYREKYFHSGWKTSNFSKTFQNIYSDAKTPMISIMTDFITRSLDDRLTDLINLLVTIREYIFIFFTSSDFLVGASEDALSPLKLKKENLNKITIKKPVIGELNFGNYESTILYQPSANDLRYVNLILFTKQANTIFENELEAGFKNQNQALTRETIKAVNTAAETVTAKFSQLYNDMAVKCMYRTNPTSIKAHMGDDRGVDSSVFREVDLKAPTYNGIVKLLSKDVKYLAGYCGGYLVSDGSWAYSNAKTGIKTELFKAKDNEHEGRSKFIVPNIKLHILYTKLTTDLVRLKLSRDFYRKFGDLAGESDTYTTGILTNVKNTLKECSTDMDKIRSFLLGTKQWSNCPEVTAIFKAFVSEYKDGPSLFQQATNLSKEIKTQIELTKHGESLVKTRQKVRGMIFSSNSNLTVKTRLSLLGLDPASGDDQFLETFEKKGNTKAKDFIKNERNSMYNTLEKFLKETGSPSYSTGDLL